MINREFFPKYHTGDGIGEINAWVKARPINDVGYWIEQILKRNRQAYPEQLWEMEQKLGDTGAGALETIARAENNPAFQKKVWDGLELITGRIKWDNIVKEDVEYVSSVLRVIGTLKVQPLQNVLAQLTDQKTLLQKNLGEEGPRLHVTALASLGAFGCKDKTVRIFERDIQEPFYAALCYRVLWRYNPKYASQYANLMRDMDHRTNVFLQNHF